MFFIVLMKYPPLESLIINTFFKWFISLLLQDQNKSGMVVACFYYRVSTSQFLETFSSAGVSNYAAKILNNYSSLHEHITLILITVFFVLENFSALSVD